MNKRYRDSQGKAIKWKDTRFGRKHYARLIFIQKAMLTGLSSGIAEHVYRIQAAPATTPEMKIKKALAIADAILKGQAALMKTYNVTRQWFN